MERKKVRKFSKEEVAMIVTMWRYKFRIRDIAERYGVSYDRVVGVIRGYNYIDKL